MTTPTSTGASLTPAPSKKKIDKLVNEYAEALRDATAAKTAAKIAAGIAEMKETELTGIVQAFGVRHTEKSKRLYGLHSFAMTTTGTRTTIDDDAVETFRTYLEKKELIELSGRFFVAQTTYSLVEGPQEVLKTLDLATKIRDKISSLLGLCFKIKTNEPSLKIEIVQPETPAKNKAA